MRGTGWKWMAGMVAAFGLAAVAQAVPFWGAKESRSADTMPSALAPGEWIWGGDDKTMGPMVMLVSLTEQRAYVYRNGVLEAVSTVSTGKPGHETPTGVFTILQKDKDHRSSTYNNAPMPYQERLTWDGVALHAGGLPGFPESHGCVHLPSEFARRLFDATTMGMTVVIAKDGVSHSDMVHPLLLSPVAASGADAAPVPLAADEPFRWTPAAAPLGPVSLVLSRSDQRLVVLRNGVEIGRTRVQLRRPGLVLGTHAYVMGSGYMQGTFAQFPQGRAPQWMAIAIPGHEDDAGRVLDRDAIDNVVIPAAFAANVYPLLVPGTVLVATDAGLLPQTTGARVQVVNADPPHTL